MKINTREPRMCTAQNVAFTVIEKLRCLGKIEFADVIGSFFPLELDTTTCLSDWVDVLNNCDDILCDFIAKYKHFYFVNSINDVEDMSTSETIEENDVDGVLRVLQFTANLLQLSYSKDIYNSVEYLVELLGCFNFKIVSASLECLHSLGLPPANHRCEYYLERHTTNLHKSVNFFASFFDIVESAFNSSRITEYLSETYSPSKDYIIVRLDPSITLFSRKDSSSMNSPPESSEIFSFDASTDSRDIGSIIKSLPSQFLLEQRFSVFWQTIIKKMVTTIEGRKSITVMVYQATSIILNCHPDAGVVIKYFLNKIELIKDFILLLGTGPGATTYDVSFVNSQIRTLGCQCLSALLETHDHTHSHTSMIDHHPWIVHEIGVGRGQFLGLMPNLLRSSSLYIINLKKGEQSDNMTQRIQWIENVFSLLAVVASTPAALPSLLDNGLVSSLLSIIECPFDVHRTTDITYLEALVLEIIEISLNSNPLASVSFRDHGGLNTIVNRLSLEVNRLIESRSFGLASVDNILIQVLVSMLTAYMQEGRETADGTHLLLLRNNVFTDTMRLIFMNADFFSAMIISSAITLLVDVINRDAAPPTVLNGMITCNVPQEALLILRKVHSPSLFEIPTNILNLISALSITADGQAAVVESQVFKDIFKLYYNDQYFLPISKTMNQELACNIGAGLEEIVRHHPEFVSTCLGELFLSLLVVAELGEQLLQNSFANSTFESNEFTEKYLSVFNFGEAICATLEPLLMKKQTIEYFLARKGFDILMRLWNLSLGPPKFLLSSLASLTYAVPNSVGYTCLQESVTRCIYQIVEVDCSMLVEIVVDKITDCLVEVEKQLVTYWNADLDKNRRVVFDQGRLLMNILETISQTPIQNIESLEDQLAAIQFSNVIRPLLILTRLFHVFGSCLSAKMNKENHDKCMDIVRQRFSSQILVKLVNELFISSLKEMARSRTTAVLSNMVETSFVQPYYHLVITGSSVSVKDGIEEGSKKVTRLSKGCRVVAYERAYSTNNALKYRIKEGWISVFKSPSYDDPQCMVYDLTRKSEEESLKEIELNQQSLGSDNQKRYIFARLTTINVRRTGVVTLLYLQTFMRDWVISPLCKSTLLRPPHGHPSEMTRLHSSASDLYPTWSLAISSLLRDSSKASASSLFAKATIPSLTDFSFQDIFLTGCAIDLAHGLLFSNKSRSRSHMEINVFLLTHWLNKDDILEKIIENSGRLLLCAFNPFILGCNNSIFTISEEHLIRLGVDTSNGWYLIKDENLVKSGVSQDYNNFRLHYRERTISAVSSAEGVIEFWKCFLSSLYINNSNDQIIDSIFGTNSNGASNTASTEALKRKLLSWVYHYLQPFLANPLLPTLPPKLSRLCIELTALLYKAQSGLKDNSNRRFVGRPQNMRAGLPFLTGRAGMLFGDPLLGPTMRRAPAPAFSPDQTVVQNMIEMGFERNAIIGGMRTLHTNDPNALVPFLLDNPYLSSIPVEEEEVAPAPLAQNDEASSGLQTAENPVNDSATADGWRLNLLNQSPFDEEMIGQLKERVQQQHQSMLCSALDSLFDLLEKGILEHYGLLDPEVASVINTVSKENFSIMLLNQSFKFFDELNISEINVRLVESIMLWKRLSQTVSCEIEKLRRPPLDHLLTALLVLTVGKISNFIRSPSATVDMLAIFAKLDGLSGTTCLKLIELMHEVLFSAHRTGSQLSDADVLWCVPGLLLIDTIIQPMSVDHQEMRAAVRDLENIYNKESSSDLHALVGSGEIISVETKSKLQHFVDGSKESSTLPLLSFSLAPEIADKLIESLQLIMSLPSNLTGEQRSAIDKAALQLLVHVQSQYDCRNKLVEMNIHQTILRTKSQFEGLCRMIVTTLQRLLEDDHYLKQSFKSSMKVVYDRLMKKSSSEVTFKSFMELCCPLLYRHQAIFLECLEEKFSLKNKHGALLIVPNLLSPLDTMTSQQPSHGEEDPTVVTKKMRTCESTSLGTKVDTSEISMARKAQSSVDHKARLSKSIRHQVCQQIIDDVLKQILSITQTQSQDSGSSLTISQLLSIVSDLIVSNPSFLTLILRHRVPVFSSSSANSSMTLLDFLIRHLICSPPQQFLNETFGEVVDASRYLFAAIFSRSGESRSDTGQALLSVLLDCMSLKEHQSKVVAVVDTILSLVIPCSKWIERDSFVIPTHEIIKWMIENKVLPMLMAIFSQLKPNDVQDRLIMRSLGTAIDVLMKKGQQGAAQLIISEPKSSREDNDNQVVSNVTESSAATAAEDILLQGQVIDYSCIQTESSPQEDDWDAQEDLTGSHSHDGNESELEPSPNDDGDDDDDDDDDDVIELEEVDDEDPMYVNRRRDVDDDSSDSDQDHQRSHHEDDSESDHADDDEAMSVDEDHHSDVDEDANNHIHETSADQDMSEGDEFENDEDDEDDEDNVDEDDDEEDDNYDDDDEDLSQREESHSESNEFPMEQEEEAHISHAGSNGDDEVGAGSNHEVEMGSGDSSNHEPPDQDVVDDEHTVTNGTDDFENDIIMAPPSPQSILFDDIERSGDVVGLDRGTVQRRHSREPPHRSRLAAGGEMMHLPPGLVQLLSGSSLGSRMHAGDGRLHRRSVRAVPGEHVSIEDFFTNMLNSGEVTSSSARVDPRTGSITLNISRRSGGAPTHPPANGNSNTIFHPLLNLPNDLRRLERSSGFSQLISGSRGTALSVLGINSNREQSFLTFDPSKSGTTRGTNVAKRREVGPLLSDRRWGLDIGEIDPCGSNIPSIITSVESIAKTRLKILPNDHLDEKPSDINPKPLPLNQILESFMGSITQNQHLLRDFGLFPEETKEEPAVLQESKEPEEETTITTSQPQPPVNIPSILSSQVPEPTNTHLSQENVEFINSLPGELRQEVLVAAEVEFLQTLTPQLQAEARILRGEPEPPVIEPHNSVVQVVPTTSVPSLHVEPSSNIARTSKPRVSDSGSSDQRSSEQIDSALLMNVAKGIDGQLPCSTTFIIRTLHWLYVSRNDHLSTVLLKLLANFCRYNDLRRNMLSFFVAILSDSIQDIQDSVKKLIALQPTDEQEVQSALEEFVSAIELTPQSLKSAIHRKLLATLSVLLRKTDNAVWLDVMCIPSQSEQADRWLFESLVNILSTVAKTASVDLDSSLQLVEKFCLPYAKLTVKQINNLIANGDSLQAIAANGNSDSLTARKILLPFPVLNQPLSSSLASIVGVVDGSSVGRKSLMRIMRYLSLFDANWKLLLNDLSRASFDLIGKASASFNNINNALQLGISNGEEALTIMMRPEFANSQITWEVRLLNALRMMTVLRARSGPASKEESLVVSQFMQSIDISGLWDCLCDCLDSVREVEGIMDISTDESADVILNAAGDNRDPGSAPNRNPANGGKSEKQVLSPLVTRFIPLMECCLMIYEKVALVNPSQDDGMTHAVNSSAEAAAGPENPQELVRTNSVVLPGSRFRQSSNYKLMQMEIKDDISASKLGRFTDNNRTLLNIILKNNVHLLETSFSPLITVPKCRSFLHFNVKRAYFKARLKKMRQHAVRQNFHGSLRIQVRRNHVFEESFQALRSKTADEMRRKMVVSFHGEEGMDAGGLTREWYSVLAREIFNANYALFISAGDNVTFQPNPHSYVNHHHLSYFKFIGRVIGKAICDGHLLDVHFTRSFYKHILGLPVTIQDLEAIEPDYYKSLIQILDTPLDLLGLDLSFSAEINEFGQISTVDLIPNGRDIAVTDDNKHDYVKLLAHHRMTSAITKQTDVFLEGFHELVPAELISIFDAQELELLISGLPEIDLDDLRSHTDYHGYKSTDPAITSFWNALKSFSKEEKALFLQFVTGTSKVPLDGFKALQGADGVKQFNIHKAFGEDKLPTAHTCFNQLDLPEYATEELMREKLLLAIKEGSEGFGFA